MISSVGVLAESKCVPYVLTGKLTSASKVGGTSISEEDLVYFFISALALIWLSGQVISQRKGIKISDRARELYEKRDKSLDSDPNARPLPPDKWATAMRREEFFRPIKKQTTVRLDADVLAWLKSKGTGRISRVNEIPRSVMIAELKR